MITPRRDLSSRHVSAHYDELDSLYREIWGEHVHHGLWLSGEETRQEAAANLARQVMRWLDIRSNQEVCDIGCGYGATARMIAEQYSAHVTGVSISRTQIEKGRRRIPKAGKTTLLLADWLKNPFGNSVFDHAFAIESSEHMRHHGRFLSEAFRVLRPGGGFVLCAWLSSEVPSSLESKLLLEPICDRGCLFRMGSRSEHFDWLKEAGFEIKDFSDLSPQVSSTWSICATRMISSWLRKPGKRRFDLLQSLVRMRAAYAFGSLRYGIFKAVKPLS